MKKRFLLPCILVCVVLIGAAVWYCSALHQQSSRAESLHTQVLQEYEQLRANLEASLLTVYEDGTQIGIYSLSDLGLLESAIAELDAQYSDTDRMRSDAFSALSHAEKRTWMEQTHPENVQISASVENFHSETILSALRAIPRTQPQDAYMSFAEGAFLIHDAVPGTVLLEDVVIEALQAAVPSLRVTTDAPASVSVELTDYDCYLAPTYTRETGEFHPEILLENHMQDWSIELSFQGEIQTLDGSALSDLVSLGDDHRILVDTAALDALISDWNTTYSRQNTHYLFDSFAAGLLPIEFLTVDYALDCDSLKAQLLPMLESLASGTIDVPFFCTRNGLPFGITDTYIEVDITTQHMAYYLDGKLIIDTDIVTGDPYVSATPRGLYYTFYKDEDLWLVGPTWNDFVDYWISVTTDSSIGLHDADWQSDFGSDVYLTHGSHGCVNTPKDAIRTIYENLRVEDAVPILVFLHPGDEY